MEGKEVIDLFESSARLIQEVGRSGCGPVQRIADAICSCFERGGKLLVFGNGGSASQAQHFAAEFVNRYRLDRIALPAIALTTDTSILTSVGNDLDFTEIFARQIAALGRKGDIAWGLSTSGKSPNVIRAFAAARRSDMLTVSFTGRQGSELARISDIALTVAADHTGRIQEAHLVAGHTVCELVEAYYHARHRQTP
jgi:D-sedoheptulose 7-phosphate isomerase